MNTRIPSQTPDPVSTKQPLSRNFLPCSKKAPQGKKSSGNCYLIPKYTPRKNTFPVKRPREKKTAGNHFGQNGTLHWRLTCTQPQHGVHPTSSSQALKKFICTSICRSWRMSSTASKTFFSTCGTRTKTICSTVHG